MLMAITEDFINDDDVWEFFCGLSNFPVLGIFRHVSDMNRYEYFNCRSAEAVKAIGLGERETS